MARSAVRSSPGASGRSADDTHMRAPLDQPSQDVRMFGWTFNSDTADPLVSGSTGLEKAMSPALQRNGHGPKYSDAVTRTG